MERTRSEEGYSRTVPVRMGIAVAAAKKGAAAAIIRSVATGNSRFPHTGYMRYDDDVPKIPAAAVSVPDAMLLDRFIKAKKQVRVRLTVGGRSLPDEVSANVVGEIVGHERPNEVLLIGAHLDSWDLGTGALDDGAGVGMVLETGKLLARAPERPRRTVRVVLFANEEFGLSGGRAYAEAHQAELKDHVLAIEADFGAGGAYEVSYLAGPGAGQSDGRALRAAVAARRRSRGEGRPARRRSLAAARGGGPHGRSRARCDDVFRLSPHRRRHVRQDRPADARPGYGRFCDVCVRGEPKHARPRARASAKSPPGH